MPKAPRSAKQKVADLKKLADWEAKQAKVNRISDNKEMILIGYVLGSVVILIAGFIGMSLGL